MIFSIMSWSMCIDVEASSVTVSDTFNVTLDDVWYSMNDITYKDLDCWYLDAFDSFDYGYESFFYMLGCEEPFFTTDSSVYAYEITFTGNGDLLTTGDVQWYAPVIGSHSQLVNKTCLYGLRDSCFDGVSSTVWFQNDYSVQDLSIGILFYLHEYYNENWDEVVSPSIDFETSFSFEIKAYKVTDGTGYIESQLQQSIESSQVNQQFLIEQGAALQEQSEKLDSISEQQEQQIEEEKEQTETQKGILAAIKSFFGSFFDNLIDSIVGIFIPDSETMHDLFNRFDSFFSDTFGFLYFPFEFFVDFISALSTDAQSNGTVLTFPGFSIMGHEVWSDISYDLMDEPVVNDIFGYVRIGTGCLLSVALFLYLREFFEKRFGGGGN